MFQTKWCNHAAQRKAARSWFIFSVFATWPHCKWLLPCVPLILWASSSVTWCSCLRQIEWMHSLNTRWCTRDCNCKWWYRFCCNISPVCVTLPQTKSEHILHPAVALWFARVKACGCRGATEVTVMFYTVADRSYQCISARLEDQKLVTFPSFGSDKPSKPKLGKYFFALLQDANGIDHIIFATAVGVICDLFFWSRNAHTNSCLVWWDVICVLLWLWFHGQGGPFEWFKTLWRPREPLSPGSDFKWA